MVELLADDDYGQNITVPGYVTTSDDSNDSDRDEVGAGYFQTMGIPLIGGREFTLGDHASSPKVAIVNETFGRHFFPGQNPLGQHFARGGSKIADIEIIGLVKDSKYDGVKKSPPRLFYTPHRQEREQRTLVFYLCTAIEPTQIASEIRGAVATLDANLPILGMKTMEDQIDENLFRERMLSMLTVSFAALATLLAALGLYGVLAYNIARRTREIGIRMALGANAARVRGLVIREVALMILVGSAAGLGAAVAAGKLVENALYGLKPWDASVYFFLWLIAFVAAYIPSRRATGVDPLVALRYE